MSTDSLERLPPGVVITSSKPRRDSTGIAPRINRIRLPSPLAVRLGERYFVNAEVVGIPRPRVRWFVGKDEIESGNEKYATQRLEHIYSLIIKRASGELNTLPVTLKANNEVGVDTLIIDIRVYKGR